MLQLRFIHRIATLIVVVIALFLSVTGTLIQIIDLHSIYAHVQVTDPNARAMRESFDGPPDYAVRSTADYLAKPLPADADYAAMLNRVTQSAHARLGDAPVRFIEFRMAGDKLVGIVALTQGHASFDAATGVFIAQTSRDIPEEVSPASARNTIKSLHRMTSFGDKALYVNIIAAISLAVLIVTGAIMYLKLLFQRRELGRKSLFWSAGGLWRSLHRAVSVVCVLFLTVATLSGAWLASDGLYRSYDVAAQARAKTAPADHFTPLETGELPGVLKTTLTRLQAVAPNAPIQVVRLRHYGIYRQGVVVTGGENSRQLVFNADTGARMTETEPGYPRVHFPFGWQAHQWAKNIHRGDIIGLPGRWMDLIAGLAMFYLSLSGAVMYWQMWQRRRVAGRKALVWK